MPSVFDSGFTYALVARSLSPTSGDAGVFRITTSAYTAGLTHYNTDSKFYSYFGAGARYVSSSAIARTPNDRHSIIASWSGGGSAADMTQRIDGVLSTTKSSTPSMTLTDVIGLGRTGTTSGVYWSGALNEIVVFSRQLSDDEQNDLAAYFKARHSL